MNEGTSTRALATHVWNAIHNPEIADHNSLLLAADDLLNMIKPGDLNPEITTAARAMAFCAADYAVFGGDHYRLRLDNAAQTFYMLAGLAKASEKLTD